MPTICPPDSTGQNVVTGCACNSGFTDTVTQSNTSADLFYTCTPAAPTVLSVGDIIFTSYASTTSDVFSFLNFVQLNINTTIFFTDKGVLSNGVSFISSEGYVRFTVLQVIPAGTVISYFQTLANTSQYTWTRASGFGLGTGDQVIGFQSTNNTDPFASDAVITHLCLFDDTGAPEPATDTTTGMVPSNLALGYTAIIFPNTTIAGMRFFFNTTAFGIPTALTQQEWITAINNVSYWIIDSGVWTLTTKPNATVSILPATASAAVVCPVNSTRPGLGINITGIWVTNGCTCNAGFRGSVTLRSTAPFYRSTCAPAACPNGTTGTSVVSGCVCNAGYNSTVTPSVIPSNTSPFYINSCVAVACPPNSTGLNVVTGCTCNSGFLGSVNATTIPPFFYTSTCVDFCTTGALLADVRFAFENASYLGQNTGINQTYSGILNSVSSSGASRSGNKSAYFSNSDGTFKLNRLFPVSNGLTVSMWVSTLFSSDSLYSKYIIDDGVFSVFESLNSYRLFLNPNGQVSYDLQVPLDLASLNQGGWHHIVISVQPTTAYVKIDGVAVGYAHFGNTLDVSYRGVLNINTPSASSVNSFNQIFAVKLDDVLVFSRALSDEEMVALYLC